MNYIVITFLIFLTTALLVEALLYFPLPPRLRYCLRLLPILKMIIDPLRVDLANWGDPLLAAEGTRFLTVGTFHLGFSLDSGHGFFVSDLVPLLRHPTLQLTILLLLLTLFLLRLIIVSVRYRNFSRWFQSLKATHVQDNICRADYKGSPFAVGIRNPKIYFPSSLQLSPEEFQAVLNHEKRHILCRDMLVGFLLKITTLIFCWVPLRFWIKRITFEAERDCDQSGGEHLLSAFQKTVSFKHSAFVQPLSLKHRILYLEEKRPLRWYQGIVFILMIIILMTAQLWIF